MFQAEVSRNIGNSTIKVRSGDMTQLKCDAYLVPSYENAFSVTGVGKSIIDAAGFSGAHAYDNLAQNGKISAGDILLTPSFGGNSNFLIHLATLGIPENAIRRVIKDSLKRAFDLAEQSNLSSLVAPALGAGLQSNISFRESAGLFLEALQSRQNSDFRIDLTVSILGHPGWMREFSEVISDKRKIGEVLIDLKSARLSPYS